MIKLTIFVALLLFVAATTIIDAHTIKHIIVVMVENRAFDFMVGQRPGVEGVKIGGNCNPVDLRDPSQGEICITANAPDAARCDPNHDTWSLEQKSFGYKKWFEKDFVRPGMKGYVDTERRINLTNALLTDYCDIMKVPPVGMLPVTNAMADEFALFQKFFPSFLGPTWPNRLFFLTGTSAGLTETSIPWYLNEAGRLYPQKTILDQVLEAGLTAKYYANDTWWELMVESLAHNPEILKLTSDLWEDARTGNLPNFAFINPRAGCDVNTGATSQDGHPNHLLSVMEGFLKDIYESLRASPQWNDTLLVYTFDEGGAFQDHFPVPTEGIPRPDSFPSWPDPGINFDMLGPRIPTLLMSPWIPKGVLIDDPLPQGKPHRTSQFELTSIMGTVRQLLGIPDVNLTARDAWSARFTYLFDQLSSPRTDCPMHLPDAYAGDKNHIDVEKELPLNGLQQYHAKVHGHLSGRGYPHHITKQGEISEWLQSAAKEHKDKTLRWKRSKRGFGGNKKHKSAQRGNKRRVLDGLLKKHDDDNKIGNETDVLYLRCQAMIQPSSGPQDISITNAWNIQIGRISTPYRTIFSNITTTNATTGVTSTQFYCFTADETMDAGSEVGLSICYPEVNPVNNRDKYQWFVWGNDTTIRPYLRPDLCVSNDCYSMSQSHQTHPNSVNWSSPVTLQHCQNVPQQHWSYQGLEMGIHQQQEGTINYGDAIMALAVTTWKGEPPHA